MGDWNNPTYIISQVFVILAYVCLFVTYQIRGRRLMLGMTISANTLMGIGFALLGAWVGLAMCCVAICRDMVSESLYRRRKETERLKTTKLDWWLLALWIIALVALTVLTEEGWITWFAMFATMAFTVSIWQKNILVYKVLGIFVSVFWLIYNLGVENLFGIILELVLLIGVMIGLTRFVLDQKKKPAAVN